MARAVILVVALLSSSCASIEPRPFNGPNARPAYSMECTGFGRTLHACLEKAGQLCPSGYQIVNQSTGVVAAGGMAAPKITLAVECR